MIKLGILLSLNLLRLLLCKLRYGARYKSNLVERFSMGASVRLFDKGSCLFGKNIELSKGVDIQVHGQGNVQIGSRTYMNRYCMISSHCKVTIGKNCMFGPSVKIFDNNHKFTAEKGVSSGLKVGEIIIGDNCWIASNVILLKGAKIGDNCVIGAGCIINRPIPSGSIIKLSQTQTLEQIR